MQVPQCDLVPFNENDPCHLTVVFWRIIQRVPATHRAFLVLFYSTHSAQNNSVYIQNHPVPGIVSEAYQVRAFYG